MVKIVSYGEVMMRLNPDLYYRLDQTTKLEMHFTGTGLNVLSGLALNGFDTRLITALPNNRVGDVAKQSIHKVGIDASHVLMTGNHIGIYILEMGHQYRPSQVTYLNRSESAFNHARLTDEQIEDALEGATHLHLCGIALSTSKASRNNVLKLATYAELKHISVIFDFNYRPSLNQEMDESELLDAYKLVLAKSNLVVGSPRDVLKFSHHSDASKAIFDFMNEYHIDTFIGTHKSESEGVKQVQGFVYHDDMMTTSTIYSVSTIDRIGTGDAFVSGYLNALLMGETIDYAVEYATCTAHLAYTTIGDAPILDDAFIRHYMEHKPDVIR